MRRTEDSRFPIGSGLLFALALCAACSAPGPTRNPVAWNSDAALPATRVRSLGLGTAIKHVVIVIQENRSLNNIFAGFPGADAKTFGFLKDGTRVPLRPIDFNTLDLAHNWASGHVSWDQGKMDGYGSTISGGGAPLPVTYTYAYLQRPLVKPYWTMAEQYVLADRMFPTEFGPSFTGHLDLIAATTELSSTSALINAPSGMPWGCDAPSGTGTQTVNTALQTSANGPFPCFTQFATMADTLDLSGVSWKYYAPDLSDLGGQLWSPFDAIKNVREGSDWATHVITPQTTVLVDSARNALASVTWVVPDYQDSDHAGSHSDTGPSWVASVVNAIGESSAWNSTAIVVVWDDSGGWYDNAPPPQLDYLGLGERVPCLIISPYAKQHYVSHTQYEFGSVLKFVEQVFGLPSLGASDARATSLIDSFDFTQNPRAFVPISVPYPTNHFLRERPSRKAPDDV